ncbi:MAG: hypothetical protein V2J55_07310, partial [Candidatus Competibacteraceae bacterium]|nr:hypothetical protein [Candidatus Competibacteraceae bacterium]
MVAKATTWVLAMQNDQCREQSPPVENLAVWEGNLGLILDAVTAAYIRRGRPEAESREWAAHA